MIAMCVLPWVAVLPAQEAISAPAPPPAAAEDAKTPAAPKTPTVEKGYIIGPLDVLFVSVWNNPQLSGLRDVRPDGMISMPLIGEVKADGLTLTQLKEAIEARLKTDVLVKPEVDIQLTKINSKRYFVYGGVFHPGPFPLIEKKTVMDAISEMGGFKDFAKPNKIEIHRGTQVFHFNYKDFIKGKNLDKNVNIELQNGDRIIVPE
jgi:polysaccharide biosynthesis/export protein